MIMKIKFNVSLRQMNARKLVYFLSSPNPGHHIRLYALKSLNLPSFLMTWLSDRKPSWPQIPPAPASSSYFGRRSLWTLASLFTLLWLVWPRASGLNMGAYSVWGSVNQTLFPWPALPTRLLSALVSVWLPSNLTKCYLSYLYVSIDTFLCISGNNLLCPMIFIPF